MTPRTISVRGVVAYGQYHPVYGSSSFERAPPEARSRGADRPTDSNRGLGSNRRLGPHRRLGSTVELDANRGVGSNRRLSSNRRVGSTVELDAGDPGVSLLRRRGGVAPCP